MSEDRAALGRRIRAWMDEHPRFFDETDDQWKERSKVDLMPRAAPAPRQRWTMAARGLIAAYLVGILVSGLKLDPRAWDQFAGACAFAFLFGWLYRMKWK